MLISGKWRARQDPNLQPSNSKPDTLSSWATSAQGIILSDSIVWRNSMTELQLVILRFMDWFVLIMREGSCKSLILDFDGLRARPFYIFCFYWLQRRYFVRLFFFRLWARFAIKTGHRKGRLRWADAGSAAGYSRCVNGSWLISKRWDRQCENRSFPTAINASAVA